MEEEEASIEEEVEGLIGAEEADLIEEAEVAAEAVLTGSKTTVLQNMLLVSSCKHWPCLKMGFKRKETKHGGCCSSEEGHPVQSLFSSWRTELIMDFFCVFCLAALGEFVHPCEDEIVCKCTTEENKVPYFNAPVYLENKEQIGKVDEIFGQLRDFVSFSCCVDHSVGPLCKQTRV